MVDVCVLFIVKMDKSVEMMPKREFSLDMYKVQTEKKTYRHWPFSSVILHFIAITIQSLSNLLLIFGSSFYIIVIICPFLFMYVFFSSSHFVNFAVDCCMLGGKLLHYSVKSNVVCCERRAILVMIADRKAQFYAQSMLVHMLAPLVQVIGMCECIVF